MSGPKKIGDVVAGLLARKGYARVQSASAFETAWREAAGKLAEHSRPGNVNRGVLEVMVRNSAALQELTFQKKKLLTRLQAQLPDEKNHESSLPHRKHRLTRWSSRFSVSRYEQKNSKHAKA